MTMHEYCIKYYFRTTLSKQHARNETSQKVGYNYDLKYKPKINNENNNNNKNM